MSVTYDAFRRAWLAEIVDGNPSSIEKGKRFSSKLLSQWLEIETDTDGLYYCDGSGDGGIDIAYLQQGDDGAATDENTVAGDTWYLVQGKYGKAFQGNSTLIEEGIKVIDTLEGRRALSSVSKDVLEYIETFRKQASENDRIKLVFATIDPLTPSEKKIADDIRDIGQKKLGMLFDVDAVSVETIFERVKEEAGGETPLRVPITLQGSYSSGDLQVAAISIYNLYRFLKQYKEKTGDLDRLFDRNVRRFLGSRSRVNKRMRETLREAPERFGLYNNGITMIASKIVQQKNQSLFELVNPYIVNGCQTTRTIWDVCDKIYAAGGTGKNVEIADWMQRASNGMIVLKIVRVDREGYDLQEKITRFTNSQTAVRERDFLALSTGFKRFQEQMADRYGVYLEIQRGGWESQQALQNQNPKARRFVRWANAFDLLRVYGAGWYSEAGTAQGGYSGFAPPDGSVYKVITDDMPNDEAFGVDDLYAAFLLQSISKGYTFGRQAEQQSRRQTRYLYYMTVVTLLRLLMGRHEMPTDVRALSKALIALLSDPDESTRTSLCKRALGLIDNYFVESSDYSVYKEPPYVESKNIRNYFKLEKLGKSDDVSPNYRYLLNVYSSTLSFDSSDVEQKIISSIKKSAMTNAVPI